jgi:hypothetical protein
MNTKLIVQNSENGDVFDATTLMGAVQYTTSLYGQAGRLTFNLEEDPNEIFKLTAGSIVSLSIDGEGIFYGYIFTMGTDATGVYKITAFDQMRYLRNEDAYVAHGVTASGAFSELCVSHGLKHEVVVPSLFVPEAHYFSKNTIFSIMEHMINRTNIAEPRTYFIRDNFGILEFTTLDRNKSDLIIGDSSMLTSYQYEISIDKNTFNTIKVMRDNEETGRRDVWIEFDSNRQRHWGRLQKVEHAAPEMNESEIRSRAASLLRYHNHPSKTLKMTAVGVPGLSIKNLVAGCGFRQIIKKIGVHSDVWITGATHTIQDDFHTMSLDVYMGVD